MEEKNEEITFTSYIKRKHQSYDAQLVLGSNRLKYDEDFENALRDLPNEISQNNLVDFFILLKIGAHT